MPFAKKGTQEVAFSELRKWFYQVMHPSSKLSIPPAPRIDHIVAKQQRDREATRLRLTLIQRRLQPRGDLPTLPEF